MRSVAIQRRNRSRAVGLLSGRPKESENLQFLFYAGLVSAIKCGGGKRKSVGGLRFEVLLTF